MCSLLEHPLNAPRVLVAETQLVIQGRKAMGLARFFHFIQLRNFKFMIFDDSPNHASPNASRGQTAVHADDDGVLSGPAVFLPYCCSCAAGIRSIPHQDVILVWFSEIGCIEIQETSWLNNDRAAGPMQGRNGRADSDSRTWARCLHSPAVRPCGTQELFRKFGTGTKLESSSFRGRAVQR
jgi:hypothetical protein